MKASKLLANYPDNDEKRDYMMLLSSVYVAYLEDIIKALMPDKADFYLKQAKIHAVETVEILLKKGGIN